MDVPTIILGTLGAVAAAGAVAVFFKRSAGVETIKLLQTNIQAYKDSELLKDREISYLKGQLDIKERVIARLANANGKDKSSS